MQIIFGSAINNTSTTRAIVVLYFYKVIVTEENAFNVHFLSGRIQNKLIAVYYVTITEGRWFSDSNLMETTEQKQK